MLGILRVASRKPLSISAPSTISALARPSLAKWPLSALVLAAASLASSMMIMPPSLALAGAAGALLLVHLLAGTPDLGAPLHLMSAGAALGELPHDAALDEILARR